jgi:hypothetical protein
MGFYLMTATYCVYVIMANQNKPDNGVACLTGWPKETWKE